MIIRITEKSEGIEHYFETGIKKGRKKSREEMDRRVYLSGDLDAFANVVRYTNKTKKWKNHYWHITGSFAIQDQYITDEKIKNIHREMLEYYFCRYNPEKIIHASEIHRPRIQTGALGQQRLLHFHMAISKWDQETDNQLRMIPYRHRADKAFQSYLALKYGLEDPANHKRSMRPGPEDLAAMQGKIVNPNSSKKLSLPAYKKELQKILVGVASVDDAIKILESQEDITSVVFKKTRRKDPETGKLVLGNKYLQIKSTIFPKTRNINLQGKGFESLEKRYYTPEELEDRRIRGKYKPLPAPDHWSDHEKRERVGEAFAQRAIFLEHQKWWKKQAPAPAKKKKVDYRNFEKKNKARFESRSKEQRTYFVIYRFNIQEEQVRGYRIWEKNNTRFLVNNDLDVKIYDRPDKISLRIPDDPEKRKKAVALALSIAQAKGWNLKTLRINGSEEFIAETKRQIVSLVKSEKPSEAMSDFSIRKAPSHRPYLNAVGQMQKDQTEKKNANRLPKDRIKAIKKELDPQAVIDLAVEKWALPLDCYIPLKDNKIGDKRLKKKRNIIDFLTKTCNQPIGEVFPLLDNLLILQEQAEIEEYFDEIQDKKKQALRKIQDSPLAKPVKFAEIEEDSTENMVDEQDDDFGLRM